MKTAMIFAAGRGERLKPMTDTCPKALCVVKGLPLIEHHVLALAQAGFERLVINHAYLGGQIRRHLGNGSRFGVEIIYSPEPPGALETGGGLVNAKAWLGQKPFITVSADIYTDFPFAQLSLPANSKAHLVLVPKPVYLSEADFDLDVKQRVNNHPRRYTFGNIMMVAPTCFDGCPIGRYSITPHLRFLANQGQLTGQIYQGQWWDVGTPERLAALG